MGKNLIQQKRGKGSSTYRAPSFKYKGEIKLPKLGTESVKGEILDLVKCRGHSAPLAQIKYDGDETTLISAPEGVRVGDNVESGIEVKPTTGNVMPLKNIPEGTSVYNIEAMPGDGGKFVRASGGSARIVGKMKGMIIIRLPSSKQREFNPECRACIGVIAGSGRLEKPLMKAGNKYYKMKAKNKLWPKVCGVSMNAVCHPFGGSCSHHKGRPTQAPRNAPPGRKVGKIAPSRTGRRKR